MNERTTPKLAQIRDVDEEEYLSNPKQYIDNLIGTTKSIDALLSPTLKNQVTNQAFKCEECGRWVRYTDRDLGGSYWDGVQQLCKDCYDARPEILDEITGIKKKPINLELIAKARLLDKQGRYVQADYFDSLVRIAIQE